MAAIIEFATGLEYLVAYIILVLLYTLHKMKYTYKKSLGLLSRSISKELGDRLEQKLKAQNINITADQWSVLSMLRHEGESSQKNISDVFGYDKVRVLRIVRNLEDKGMLNKRVCRHDRRTRIVSLTSEGMSLYVKIHPIAEATINEATKSLSKREVDFYTELSQKIIRNLKAH